MLDLKAVNSSAQGLGRLPRYLGCCGSSSGSPRFVVVLGRLSLDQAWRYDDDEDYDDETEFNKRVDKVYKTIQEINKKSLEELNQLYNSDKMQDILKHNHGVLHDMKFNQESWEKTVLKPSWQTQEVKYLINKLDIIKKIENIEIKKINIDKSQLI